MIWHKGTLDFLLHISTVGEMHESSVFVSLFGVFTSTLGSRSWSGLSPCSAARADRWMMVLSAHYLHPSLLPLPPYSGQIPAWSEAFAECLCALAAERYNMIRYNNLHQDLAWNDFHACLTTNMQHKMLKLLLPLLTTWQKYDLLGYSHKHIKYWEVVFNMIFSHLTDQMFLCYENQATF